MISININRSKYVTIKTAVVASAVAASAVAVAATAAAIVQRKKEYHGWLKERKITFYFGRNENYGKMKT